MEIEKMLEIITLQDLCNPLDSYAKAIGIGNLYRLSEIAGGRKIYIPKPENLFKDLIKRLIADEYAHTDITQEQLAIKYGICDKSVWTYTRGIKKGYGR